jgi:hypothetical protein
VTGADGVSRVKSWKGSTVSSGLNAVSSGLNAASFGISGLASRSGRQLRASRARTSGQEDHQDLLR